jgi:hypothetical protein
MYAEFLHDPKVRVMSETDQLRLVLLFCTRCNGDVTLQDKHVTFSLRISNQEWQQTKAVFIESGFIDKHNNVLNWDKRQYVSDSSAARVAKHRTLHKSNHVTSCNVTVTPPDTEQIQNRTDTEQNRTENISHPSDAQVSRPKADAIPYQKIIELYHQTLPTLPKCEVLTSKRKGQIAARWRNGLPDLPTWKEYFDHNERA